MPEGDTVWLTAARLRSALAGTVLTATDFRVPALATADLAGIGSMYESETLFICRVNPFTAVGAVPDLPRVVDTAHRLLRRNAARASQSTTGDERRAHYVYGRGRRACYRCGSPIRTAALGVAPFGRIAYWCPTCQPAAGAGGQTTEN